MADEIETADPELVHLARRAVDAEVWCEIADYAAWKAAHDMGQEYPRRDDDKGRCPGRPVAVVLRHGFSDVVCERHAESAEPRELTGARVLWAVPRG